MRGQLATYAHAKQTTYTHTVIHVDLDTSSVNFEHHSARCKLSKRNTN